MITAMVELNILTQEDNKHLKSQKVLIEFI